MIRPRNRIRRDRQTSMPDTMGFGYVPTFTHPFYPTDLILTDYVANESSTIELLPTFFGFCALVLITTYLVARAYNPKRSRTELACVAWFLFTGMIHLFFEGYFVINHYRMPRQQDLFGQLWKEYAYSDSRYLASDSFVLCMETVTALLWGPLSFLEAYLIIIDSVYRHPIQSLISTGQIYGLILYYMTNTFDMYYNDVIYSRPEALYFWFYYFLVNFVWMVVPGVCLYSSFTETSRAFLARKPKYRVRSANDDSEQPQSMSNK